MADRMIKPVPVWYLEPGMPEDRELMIRDERLKALARRYERFTQTELDSVEALYGSAPSHGYAALPQDPARAQTERTGPARGRTNNERKET